MGLFDFFKKKQRESVPSTPKAERQAPRPDVEAKFPFPVLAVKGEEAESKLLALRQELAPEGITPVLVGDRVSAIRLLDVWDEPFAFHEGCELALKMNPLEWFQRQLESDPEAYPSMEDHQVFPQGTSPMHRLTVGYDIRQKPLPEVYIAKIPTREPWTLPLHLRFGNWNACPEAEVHAMLARYWGEIYGASIATIAADVVEFTVATPPANDADAMTLARQQYIYCNDVVDQGVGSVATLAQALKRSSRWYFWWD